MPTNESWFYHVQLFTKYIHVIQPANECLVIRVLPSDVTHWNSNNRLHAGPVPWPSATWVCINGGDNVWLPPLLFGDLYPMTCVKISGERGCWEMPNLPTSSDLHSSGSWDKHKQEMEKREHAFVTWRFSAHSYVHIRNRWVLPWIYVYSLYESDSPL